MKKLIGLGIAAAFLAAPLAVEAGGRGCSCCNVAVAPAAASPAATAQASAGGNAVAQNNQGYRSYSYQPAATMNNTSGYYRSSGRSNQPMWMNGANKALGRYN